MSQKALISEYFTSFQGEGLFIGHRQFFIRFAGCNVPRCRYCDTPEPKEPMTLSTGDLVRIVMEEHRKTGFNEISLTGGEPLLQADFLLSFLEQLCGEKKSLIYLETNSTLAGDMSRLAPRVDWVSADYKLASVTRGKALSAEHEKFFRVLERERKQYFVKAVVSRRVDRNEFSSMCRFLSAECPGRVLVIQPVMKGKRPQISPELLEELFRTAAESGIDARIIPQMHKLLKFR